MQKLRQGSSNLLLAVKTNEVCLVRSMKQMIIHKMTVLDSYDPTKYDNLLGKG